MHNLQNHPTFYSGERLGNLVRGSECFFGLSILLILWLVYHSRRNLASRISPPAVQSEPSIRCAIYLQGWMWHCTTTLDYNTFKRAGLCRLSGVLCCVSFLLNLLKGTFNYVSIQTNFAFASLMGIRVDMNDTADVSSVFSYAAVQYCRFEENYCGYFKTKFLFLLTIFSWELMDF